MTGRLDPRWCESVFMVPEELASSPSSAEVVDRGVIVRVNLGLKIVAALGGM